MTADSDNERTAREAFLAALSVARYARVALGVGTVVALGVTLLFVGLLAGGEPTRPAPLYALLAFVVFATTAMLALAVLVGRRVLWLAVHPASVVRWSATGGVVAGVAWLLGAVSLQLGPARPWASVVDVSLPWAALLTPVGVWAVYTRSKRTVRAPRIAAGAALLAVGGALVVADLAAFDLLALLPDIAGDVDRRTARLFLGGATAMVGGQGLLAALAARAEPAVVVPIAAGVVPLAGLVGLVAAGPGRAGLGALAAGMGIGWVVVGWHLREIPDADVPKGPPADIGTP